MKSIKNILRIKAKIKLIFLFAIIIILLLLIPNLDNSFVISSKLYINEIMVNNTYTYLDNNNEYSDYIEIYNGYNYPINLKGYHLSDNEFETNKWTFPDIKIESKEYLLVFASGKDTCDLENKICHTNFKLSSKGEFITLTDKSNNIINKFQYEDTSNDISYGVLLGRYMYLNNPTPGKENNTKSLKYQKISNKELYINEYIIYNKRVSYNQDGEYYDFVELYNDSNEDINLESIYLTDDINDLNKYKLPNIKIKKNDYMLIYLGDKSSIKDNQIEANFKLSAKDKYIIISNGKKIIDKVEIVTLYDNVSYGRKDGKWYYFTEPTPGRINDTLAHSSLGGQNERN